MENIETLLAAVAQTSGFGDDEPVVSSGPTSRSEHKVSTPEIRGEIGGSQLVGATVESSGDAGPSAAVNLPPGTAVQAVPSVTAAGQVIGAVEKRKRGRQLKGQLGAKSPPPKRKKQEDEEEDVCFICFDGGSLVLCDRKGCPKAYHPACIKRDEAFFQSKAKWYCGWHICSVCRKASHYTCYTCTYSLCKGCARDADYTCVRRNKGFCTTCMRTIMLIENKDQANDSIQVDFDDQTSWEYLFKMYWVLLKENLSLTLSELTRAKKPLKGVAPVARKLQLNKVHHSAFDGKVSVSTRSSGNLELNKPREEVTSPQNDRLTIAASTTGNLPEKLNSNVVEDGPSHCKDADKEDSSGEPSIQDASSMGNSRAADNIESEKLWHYRDPNGKIQGPFSMMHLRLWSTTGLFPLDMRIWTNHEQYDSLLLTDALDGKFHGASELPRSVSSESQEHQVMNGIDGDSTGCNNASVLPANSSGFVRTDESDPSSETKALGHHPSSSLGQTDVVLPDQVQESDESNHGPRNREEEFSDGQTQNQKTTCHGLHNQSSNQSPEDQSSQEKFRGLPINLSSEDMGCAHVFAPVSKLPDLLKQDGDRDKISDLPSHTPTRTEQWEFEAAEKQQCVSSDIPMQKPCILELLSPARRPNNENQEVQAPETKQSGLLNFLGANFPEVAGEWCGYSQTPSVDASTSNSNQLTHVSQSHHASDIPNWLAAKYEPIEFDALGEESVSDLLAQVDAMESQEGLPSPTSAMKSFGEELIQDCKHDCFSSIEEFSPTPDPVKSDAFSSTGEIQLSCQSSVPCKPTGPSPIDFFSSFRRSDQHSFCSSEGETNACGEAGLGYHPPAPNNNMSQDMVGGGAMVPGMESETTEPGWGTVQGNINLVTVQGNVNLVLGGPPAHGMSNLGWGTSPGTAWGNPNINQSGNLPWDGQRKYGGERFPGPRDWGYQGGDAGFPRGRPAWGRPPYGSGGGGGYSRPGPKGQRVCKFYESGHCKKGAFCDYLHP